MKKPLLFISLFLSVATVTFFADVETANTHSSGSGISGLSGSPSDGGNCTSCHGSHVQNTPTPWITSNVPVTGYVPGTTYTITAKAASTASGHNSNFGFEVSPQNSSGAVVGTLANITTSGAGSTQITSGEWVTHTSSSYTGTDSNKWSFKWTAPNPGVGAVNFYGSFNCGSGDNQSSAQIYDDSIHIIQSTIPPPPCNHYYATLPYSTSFESQWLYDSCASSDQRQPDMYWKSSIGGTTPDGDDYWHRNDYTGSDWTSPTSGAFTPAAESGTYCARFHNAPPPAASTGALDLYIDLSPSGTKTISFYVIHNEKYVSPFAFVVELSTDGGKTFSNLYTLPSAQVATWTKETCTTTSTSATAIIRFQCTDKGNIDVGLDNLSITNSGPTGIDELTTSETLDIYPNPTDGTIVNGRFAEANDKDLEVHMYDMMGREVFTKVVRVETGDFSLSFPNGQLKPGIYLFMGISGETKFAKTIIVK
jgi:hypothetical protein